MGAVWGVYGGHRYLWKEGSQQVWERTEGLWLGGTPNTPSRSLGELLGGFCHKTLCRAAGPPRKYLPWQTKGLGVVFIPGG